jgi:hypothetical protein
MEIVIKRYLLIVFAILMSQQVVKADDTASQEGLFLPQADAVLLEELDNERGRGGLTADVIALTKSNVGATMRNSFATDNVSGANYIENGSITGNSGITDVIQNSGNNVIIQNSTTLTVTISANP